MSRPTGMTQERQLLMRETGGLPWSLPSVHYPVFTVSLEEGETAVTQRIHIHQRVG